MDITVKEAKKLFLQGFLSGYEVVTFSGVSTLTLFDLHSSGQLIDVRTKKPREFKTFDSVFNQILDIGFNICFIRGDYTKC